MGNLMCLVKCADTVGLRDGLIRKYAFFPPTKSYQIIDNRMDLFSKDNSIIKDSEINKGNL